MNTLCELLSNGQNDDPDSPAYRQAGIGSATCLPVGKRNEANQGTKARKIKKGTSNRNAF